ncbi:hypothetical protein RF55_15067 [Lasius niger]|uniref:Uncharacterized protein n=1 Tax=Lasius niger TaxID=67767 RepID=A0A0J7N0A3_LASNI|nr:hypothetical protein RF55_15067 [Lasius niger]
MAVSIPNPAKCEIRSAIRFFCAKEENAAEIHCQLVYGEDVMNRQNVAKWCREFKAGRSNVHDEERSGRPSVVTDKLIQKIEEKIHFDRSLTMDFMNNVDDEDEVKDAVIMWLKEQARDFCDVGINKLVPRLTNALKFIVTMLKNK